MTNTEKNAIAFEEMRRAAERFGYTAHIRTSTDGTTLWFGIRQPKDDETFAYPEIYFLDNWYGEERPRFEIATTGYSDHSINQAQRVVAGLQIALACVREMERMGRRYGIRFDNDDK